MMAVAYAWYYLDKSETMRLLLTFTTAFLFAALFSILPRNIIIKESKELNYTFVKVVPCISYSHHLILNI
jgi:hypothetical protein